jgi:hypothetical protein
LLEQTLHHDILSLIRGPNIPAIRTDWSATPNCPTRTVRIAQALGPKSPDFARFGHVQLSANPARHRRLVISFSVLRVSLVPRFSLIRYFPLITTTPPTSLFVFVLLRPVAPSFPWSPALS